MDATLILIDGDAELARARALVDQLWESDEPADIARLQAIPGSCGTASPARPKTACGGAGNISR
jgi:hypothetical protein